MTNTISFMTANYVARQIGYSMTEGWGQGDRTSQAYFQPIETYGERLAQYLSDIRGLGFSAFDLWTGILNPVWATPEHIRITRELAEQHGLQMVSLAGWFGSTPQEFEVSCQVSAALGISLLGGGTQAFAVDYATSAAILREYDVRFGHENHPEKSPDEVLAKLGDDVRVGVAADTGWWGTQGYDAARALDELYDRLLYVHLKDVRAAGAHETCRFGDGIVPLRACVDVLKRRGYTGALCVEHEPEHYDPTDEVKASYAALKEWLA